MSTFPVIDMTTIEDCYFGDMGLYSEIVSIYREQEPLQLGVLDGHLGSGNAEGVAAAAHKLKGGLLTIGAAQAAEAIRQLEQQGRVGDLSGAGESRRALADAIKTLGPALDRLLGLSVG